ncbi:MAG: tetratricopeptide repeat protein [Planctomycetota bacterium]
MKFLNKIFGGGRAAPSAAEAAPQLARELESIVAEAERLVAAGRHEEAMHVAEQGLLRFPAAARLRGVIRYVRRAGAKKRLSELKKILEGRKDERAYKELIALHLDLGDKTQALEIATAHAEEFPASADAQVLLGEVFLSRYFGELFARDAWAAIEHLGRALEINAETLRARVLLGMLYFGVGAPRHSANEISEVIAIDPSNTQLAEFREALMEVAGAEGEEDIEYLLDYAEDHQEIPNDPGSFPGGKRFSLETGGGALSPKLFAAAAQGIGRRLRIEQLAAIGGGGRPLAVAGENKESFVKIACRLDEASRRAGRHMNFGTMRRFMIEGKFGRVVLVPAGNCAVAARAPRSVSTARIAEGLEMVVTASRSEAGEEDI